MEAGSGGARAWLRARRHLAFELLPLAVTGGVLAALAPAAEASVLDARVLYCLCLGMFSVAAVDVVRRAFELLDWPCPRCEKNFCGRHPLRARCAHCGFRAGSEPPRREPDPPPRRS